MRTLKLLALGVLFGRRRAHRTGPRAGARCRRKPHSFFNVSVGGQWKEQIFTDTSTFTIYNENGAVAAAHSIGGGTLFDIGVGARVWKSLAVGIAYSTITNFNDAAISVRVPHPRHLRSVANGDRDRAGSRALRECRPSAVHVDDSADEQVRASRSWQVRRSLPCGRRWRPCRRRRTSRDPPPYNNVTITTVSLTDVKDSPVGVNVGVDGTYLIRTIKGIGIGVGGFVRYAGASLDLPYPAGMTRDTRI